MKSKLSLCLICKKQMKSFGHSGLGNINICTTCYKKLPFIYKKFKIEKTNAMAIYEYSDFIKQLILKIKAKGDLELADVLLSPICHYLKNKYHNYTIIPVPSSLTSNNKRGYNHVVEIFKNLQLPIELILSKSSNYKQSNQSRMLRYKISENIIVNKAKIVPKKRYLLVDDIITSGETLSACIKHLKSFGVTKIKVLVVAYNCRNNSKFCERFKSLCHRHVL